MDGGAGAVLGRGLAFPPRVGADGRLVWSEGETNVRESIQIVLKTERGERLRLPAFGAGLGKFLFEPNTTPTRNQLRERVGKALLAWEPRIRVESIEVEPHPDDAESAAVTVAYRLVATDALERVGLTVALGR
jgi:phage baseplate assembly protein W